MPEGPELHHASIFINQVCKGRIFSGKIVKSEVHKSDEVDWEHGDYTISATSRGKELKLTLTAVGDSVDNINKDDESKKKNAANVKKSLDIRIQFGMSGRFNFCNIDEMEKHSHLNFYTKIQKESPSQVLSFVDYRRFGKWHIGADWSPDRGPCVLLEYPAFRERVLNNLHDTAFNKPICEVLLNQKYFNGIGNYLRAEILYRCNIPPFVSARSVLEKLTTKDDKKKVTIKSETPDILELCYLLPREVVDLGANGYITDEKSTTKFTDWLQCYYNPKMKNMSDHNKRTIWFTGEPGPMVPSEQKTKRVKKGSRIVKRKSEQMIEAGEELPEILQSPTKKKKADGTRVTRRKLKEEIKKESSSAKKPNSARTTKAKTKASEETDKPKTAKSSKSTKPKETVTKTTKKSSRGRGSNSMDIVMEDDAVLLNEEGVKESGDGPKTTVSRSSAAKRVTRTNSRESTNSSSSSSSVERISNDINEPSKPKKRTSRKTLKA